MKILASILIGYILGSLSPSALISKLKHKNLKELGTKNLGASNTMLVFGKLYGVIVMIFDIAKAVVAVKLVQFLFPTISIAGILAGNAVVLGHVFPFYLKFRGGKGLAPFGGFVLAVDPVIFCLLLVVCGTLMIIANYGVAMPISAAILFPILYGLHTQSVLLGLLVVPACALMTIKHLSNIYKAKHGDEIKVRSFIKNGFSQ